MLFLTQIPQISQNSIIEITIRVFRAICGRLFFARILQKLAWPCCKWRWSYRPHPIPIPEQSSPTRSLSPWGAGRPAMSFVPSRLYLCLKGAEDFCDDSHCHPVRILPAPQGEGNKGWGLYLPPQGPPLILLGGKVPRRMSVGCNNFFFTQIPQISVLK